MAARFPQDHFVKAESASQDGTEEPPPWLWLLWEFNLRHEGDIPTNSGILFALPTRPMVWIAEERLRAAGTSPYLSSEQITDASMEKYRNDRGLTAHYIIKALRSSYGNST
ncbi:hypothetical protein PG997_005298 [Apiospora hydei]|uniref:Uncharacterized protein n=1 Tax=Apiospora hydei TaxID=1337664 RepID=A0ABR1X4M0_9PEZI